MKKILKITALFCIPAVLGVLWWLHGQHTVPVMMYHHVETTDNYRANSVSPENFERHMAYLRDHGFKVLSFEDLVRLTREGRRPPRKSAVITFDDGYADNYELAYAILKKFNFPAIIFVPTDFINTDGYLSWEQIREMVQNGISIGSHSRRHAYLPDLSALEQRDEIFGSKRILETNLGVPADYFSYPIGGFSEEIKHLVREAGYKGAAATNRGFDRLNHDVYELNRIRFGDRDIRNDYIGIKLSGYYNLFRKAKSPN